MTPTDGARLCSILIVILACYLATPTAELKNLKEANNVRFAISFPAESSKVPLDGRVLLILSTDNSKEPRFQINEDLSTQQIFGVDVDGLKPGQEAIVDAGAFGYPLRSLSQVPPGEYWVQAVLHRYETFRRSDGHTVKLPMDRGEGQQWSLAPGNLYSTPQTLKVDPTQAQTIKINLDKTISPIEPPKDTKYVKHVRIQSKLLSDFWGRPMYLGAHVLLPEGFETHPEARYPLVIFHGHFPADFDGFREQPPDPNLKPEYSDRFHLEGYNRIVQEHAYKFFQDWTGPNFPRFIIIEIQHANPYYDDSYAVNSANLGPYGDAITYELIPHIEKHFRAIGKGWARFLYGGSTGGWEALAAQVFYPNEYNGCWAACPDPIDFRAYTVVNIYEHENAYYADARWKRVPRPGKRNYLGELAATVEDLNFMELALGTNSRSGGQWDIWQAVYSPVGEDGYPKPIWDKLTGKIDRRVAEYWREHYDLGYILRRDWNKIGPSLEGKIHIYVGEADNYFLNNAVYLVDDFLKTTKNPAYGGEVDYEPRAEHCWNGDHTRPNATSRLRYHQFYAPKIVERILKSAPAGSDLTSWRY
ncbi:MAG TPA: alpha/beta hydrolase-fold protein [Pyrinomonadaceae bacterium]|nr:alpha/beta hydrolase-fold protein [Pyrinomonadaceae bacterium]